MVLRQVVLAGVANDEDDDGDAAVSLAYSERLTLGPREVALVTFDPARRALVRVESP